MSWTDRINVIYGNVAERTSGTAVLQKETVVFNWNNNNNSKQRFHPTEFHHLDNKVTRL